jgi:aldehyde:ferredoxin oxidoreductase
MQLPKVMRVDLTNRKIETSEISKEDFIDYIGGRGFGAKLAFDEIKGGIEPFDPENKLIFVTGPLAGTSAQSFGRWKVFFKSPLTNGYFKSSGGGHFASELHKAGWSVIIVSGVSEKPVYLWVDGDRVELRDAGHLWGLDCDNTHTLIRELHKDKGIRLACIGPAGENLVKYAGIFSDRRTAARGGGGTLMGQKKLKALAVRGSNKVEIADPVKFSAALKTQVAKFKGSPSFKPFQERGTQGAEFALMMGLYPVKNFRSAVLPEWENIEASAYDKIRIGKTACNNCMIRCSNFSRVREGRYSYWWSEGPEYETIWAFTGPINKADIGLTVAADRVCDDLGIDTISAGGAIAMAYELFEKGLITEKDTGGLKLTYGNSDQVLPLLEQIAYRRGFGNILADGVKVMGDMYGVPEIAMHVKGLDFPAYDPRGAKAHGLSMATAVIGADHNCGYASQELFGEEIPAAYDRLTVNEKGQLCKYNQDYVSALETGIACDFTLTRFWNTVEIYAALVSAKTGVSEFEDPNYIWLVGERIINLERLFNAREGFTIEDDRVPKRISQEQIPDGPIKGAVYEEDELLDQYYDCRGWDKKTGLPLKSTLQRLGLA